MATARDVEAALKAYADPNDAVFLQRFFKTGKGQYGEGDVFIGVRVPATRQVCREFKDLPLDEIEKLLESEVHEYRLAAVILIANQFKKAGAAGQKAVFDVYMKHVYAGHINNWDIVDVSAEFVVGEYLLEKPPGLLFELAKSDSVWQRRVAVISSFAFIKRGEAGVTLQLAEALLHDPHDLIQKAVGWMLREIGKRCDQKLLLDFLGRHSKDMPRTMLRYAIEHLTPEQRAHFMAKT